MTPENGLRATVEHHGEQLRRLWLEKPSIDAFASLERSVGKLDEHVAKLAASVETIEDVIAARPAERLAERRADEEARKAERAAEAHERKIDRRWRIGTALLCVSLIIGAMAILLPALSGGG